MIKQAAMVKQTNKCWADLCLSCQPNASLILSLMERVDGDARGSPVLCHIKVCKQAIHAVCDQGGS